MTDSADRVAAKLAGITATLICHDPSGPPERPWAVSVSSERVMLASNDQVYDLTEIRGVIYCPDRAVAEEIARRLLGKEATAASEHEEGT